MDKRATGRKVALVAGLGALGVLVGAAANWQNVAVQYYVYRMGREPDYLLELIERPEGTVQGAAVRKFLSSDPGPQALLALYLRLGFANLEVTSRTETMEIWDSFRQRHASQSLGLPFAAQSKKVIAIKSLLHEIAHRPVVLPEFPILRFEIMSKEDNSMRLHQSESAIAELIQIGLAKEWICVIDEPSRNP